MSDKIYSIMVTVQEHDKNDNTYKDIYYVAPDCEFITEEEARFIADSIANSAELTGE